MKKEIELRLLPSDAANTGKVKEIAAAQCRLPSQSIDEMVYLRRSIDARGSQPYVQLKVAIFSGESIEPEPIILKGFHTVEQSPKVLVIGAGPAGYFAALELIELGYKPIVLDRGKDVRARRRDLKAIQQMGQVHPDSNYCFGEGGAGTYSDGKLYTRSHKRGSIEKALRLLVEHGADTSILIDTHPHIGSNKLPQIVANIRATILEYGGEVHFNTRVTDVIIRNHTILGVITNDNAAVYAHAVVMATGHSARDIYELLARRGVTIEAKPFALGVRIEHPQALIDEIQYKQAHRDEHLPPSSYKLTSQVGNRGVFSFCMCPGGLIVPAATKPGEIVVNGMSMSRRDSPFANSGTVVAIELEDMLPFQEKYGQLATLKFQQMVETTMFRFGNGSQQAPAQRLTDFVHQKVSANLPKTSYIPGVYAAPLHQLLPDQVFKRLQQGVKDFGQKMRGYYTNEAVVVGTESRTSSPVRIPRNNQTLMHEQTQGLFPCGEGAGYAGGIISAAMDGQNVAKAVAKFLSQKNG